MDEGERWQRLGFLARAVLVVLVVPFWYALALQAREGGSIRYSCKRQENDGTLDGMSDVDYLCEPIGHPQHTGYWVGTDSDGITALQQTG